MGLDVLFAQAGFTPNDSQRRAIEHADGPLFLVAGPGSGKTRVLLWRVVNLVVFHGVAPDQIFLSTFTEKAAKQLQDGLIGLLALATQHTGQPYDLSGMYVGTVHSLCARLLRDRALAPGRERAPAPAVLDALDQYFELAANSFWRAAVEALGFEGELADLRKQLSALLGAEPPSASKHKVVVQLQALFNRLSEEDITPEAAFAKGDPVHAPLFTLYALYRARLGDRRVDLSLLQQAALRALEAHPPTAGRFKHVIVDEYQDTNTIQERLFFWLGRASTNVCVVGDDDQALYRFRGATVESFVQFPARCTAALGAPPRRIELAINYRSRRGIVDAYTSFITELDWGRPGGGQFRLHDKGVTAHSTDLGAAVVASAPADPDEVCAEIAGLVRGLLDAGTVADPNQIAFLFPTLKSSIVERFEAALNGVGLKVYAPRAKRFLEAAEPTLVIGLLGLILGRPERSSEYDRGEFAEFHSWLDVADERAKQVSGADPRLAEFLKGKKAELRALAKDHEQLCAVILANGWELQGPYAPDQNKRALLSATGLSAAAKRAIGGVGLEKLARDRIAAGTPLTLRQVVNRGTTADWGLLDLFYRLLSFDELRAQVDLAERGEDEGPICNLALTSQLLSRYVDTFPALITGEGASTRMLQNGFYHAFLLALFRLGEGEYEDAEDPFPRGRVPFLTIHQSKGLEFPVVVLGSARTMRRARPIEALVQPLLPEGGEPIDRMPDFDAMRMFYVALSRAKSLLVLAHPKGRGQRVDEELRPLLSSAASASAIDPAQVPSASEGHDERARRYSYTGDFLGYQRCPRQYMLFAHYGFAASRTQTMFFGSLVHATIEDLHHRRIAARAEGTP